MMHRWIHRFRAPAITAAGQVSAPPCRTSASPSYSSGYRRDSGGGGIFAHQGEQGQQEGRSRGKQGQQEGRSSRRGLSWNTSATPHAAQPLPPPPRPPRLPFSAPSAGAVQWEALLRRVLSLAELGTDDVDGAALQVRGICEEYAVLMGTTTKRRRGHVHGGVMLDLVRVFVVLVAEGRVDMQRVLRGRRKWRRESTNGDGDSKEGGEEVEEMEETADAAAAEEEQEQEQEHWLKEHLLMLMSRGRQWQGEGWLTEEVALSVAGAMQKMSSEFSNARRVCLLLRHWMQLLFMDDLEMMEWRDASAGAVKDVCDDIGTLRNEMLHTKESKMNLSSLCGMIIDGMVRHGDSRETAAFAKLLVDWMEQHDIPIQQHMIVSMTNKSSHITSELKWRIMRLAPADVINAKLIDRLLLDCQILKQWKLAGEVIQFARENNLTGPISAFRIIDITVSLGKLSAVKPIYDSLDADARWHGPVLCQVLSVSLRRRDRQWVLYLVRDVLQRSQLLHNGSWPTPFFETLRQKQNFQDMHKLLMLMCKEWKLENVHDSAYIDKLSVQWEAFYDDQMQRYGTACKASRMKPHV